LDYLSFADRGVRYFRATLWVLVSFATAILAEQWLHAQGENGASFFFYCTHTYPFWYGKVLIAI
jgi:hypothetical protein